MRLHVRGKRFVAEGELGGVGSDGRVLVCVHVGLDLIQPVCELILFLLPRALQL